VLPRTELGKSKHVSPLTCVGIPYATSVTKKVEKEMAYVLYTNTVGKIDTLILFRHGHTPGNEFIDSSDPIQRTIEQQRKDFDDYNMDLDQEGEFDAVMVGHALSTTALSVCVASPFLRTRRTPEIAFEQRDIPIVLERDVRERNLGKFAYVTRPDFHAYYPEVADYKTENPLDWVPDGDESLGIARGESLREVGHRVVTALQRQVARLDIPTRILPVSTHADVLISLLGHPQFGNMSNKALQQPLGPIANPQWIQNGDIHCWDGLNNNDEFTKHRVISYRGGYDTGWLQRGRDY